MDPWSVVAGFVAFGVSVLAAVLLVFVTYRFNTFLTRKLDEERLLLAGNCSVAVALGSVVLCQALLLRHAVFPIMAVVRDLFVKPVTPNIAAWAIGHALLFLVIIGMLSLGSVAVAGWLFARMTRSLPEHDEIMKDNLAVAIFFAFVMLAITLIVNEGLEDLSRSIIPWGDSGILRIP